MSRTEINSLGEFGLIDLLASKVKLYHPQTIMGIGDDAAVLDMGDKYLVTSADMLLEGIHFDLSYIPLKHLGYKAVAVNVSDIAAMNALPLQMTLSLGLSNRFSVEAVNEMYEGMVYACENYNIDFVGGDTTTSRSGLVISISINGMVEKQHITYRHTAKTGDIICVTGDLGAAYTGLQVLEREKQVFLANPEMQPELTGKDYIVRRQLKPEARTDMVHELRDLGIVPTAMIDISDGLASEMFHLCHKPNLGAMIYEDKLPIDQSTYDTAINDLNISPTICALNGGEDYELLFTIRQDDFEKIKNHDHISVIGYITEAEKGINLVTRQQQLIPLQAQGWKHF